MRHVPWTTKGHRVTRKCGHQNSQGVFHPTCPSLTFSRNPSMCLRGAPYSKNHTPLARAKTRPSKSRTKIHRKKSTRILGVPSPFFPGILLSRKPPETRGKRIRFLERTRVEKNGPGINPYNRATLGVAKSQQTLIPVGFLLFF